jgi:hypothetical protein
VRRGKLTVTAFQGVVDNEIVLQGTLRGVAIPADAF